MKLLNNLQKTFKNGFYLDYLFKIIFITLYINILKKNMFYIVDKYLAELFIFNIKKFVSFLFFFSEFIKKLSIINIFKLSILILIQVIILFLI